MPHFPGTGNLTRDTRPVNTRQPGASNLATRIAKVAALPTDQHLSLFFGRLPTPTEHSATEALVASEAGVVEPQSTSLDNRPTTGDQIRQDRRTTTLHGGEFPAFYKVLESATNLPPFSDTRTTGQLATGGPFAPFSGELECGYQRQVDFGDSLRISVRFDTDTVAATRTTSSSTRDGAGRETGVGMQEMESKGAIVRVPESKIGFVSPFFAVPKAGSQKIRPIVDLRSLNACLDYQKFKMESLKTVKDLLLENDFMVKIDLKDAYFAVPIAKTHQHLLQFRWKQQLFQSTCLPFGLACAPRVFTKVLHPITAVARSLGIRLVIYLDDCLLMAKSPRLLCQHLATILHLMISLGLLFYYYFKDSLKAMPKSRGSPKKVR